MEAYIKGIANLSPQNTFQEKGIPGEFISYKNVRFLQCQEPAYNDYIDPMASRRMSRIVKMGVCTALKCLKDNNVNIPDAIITGTGLGCIADTEKFLGSIYSHEEKLLNPTPFIQSTHNTVAGAIALALKCYNYNTTYAHRGFSFEAALNDALLMLKEDPGLKILAGSYDETTENSYEISGRLGLWKNHPVNSYQLITDQTRGSLAGEGVTFLILGGNKESGDLAMIKSVHTFFQPNDYKVIEQQVLQFLENNKMSPEDIDMVILGINGDKRYDHYYQYLMQYTFATTSHAWYKHLSGEYDTSASFALWLAAYILHDQHVPADILLNKNVPDKINRILIYNHLRGSDHSLLLLERC